MGECNDLTDSTRILFTNNSEPVREHSELYSEACFRKRQRRLFFRDWRTLGLARLVAPNLLLPVTPRHLAG